MTELGHVRKKIPAGVHELDELRILVPLRGRAQGGIRSDGDAQSGDHVSLLPHQASESVGEAASDILQQDILFVG